MPDRPTVRRQRAAALLAAATMSVVAGCGTADSASPAANFTENNPDGMHGAVLADQYVMPEATLTSTDGSDFSLTKDTTAPVTLVFFGYTHCPDICHIVMSDIASAVTRLDAEDQQKVDVLFITSDPARDDAATLREYLDRFNPEFEGVTGDLKTIVEVANALGVQIEDGAKLPSGGYEVAHGTQIVAVDDRDRSPIVWTEGTPASHLAEDLSALLDETESSSAS